MAIAFRTTAQANGSADTLTASVANCSTDDLMFLLVGLGDGRTIGSDPSGWSRIGDFSGVGFMQFVLYSKRKVGGESDPVVTWTTSSLFSWALVGMYDDAAGGLVTIDVAPSATNFSGSGGTTVTALAITTTQANARVMGFATCDINDPPRTWTPNSMTQVIDAGDALTGNFPSHCVAYVDQAVAGTTGAKTWTISGNENWGALLVSTYIAASVAGQPTRRRLGGVPHMTPGGLRLGRSW